MPRLVSCKGSDGRSWTQIRKMGAEVSRTEERVTDDGEIDYTLCGVILLLHLRMNLCADAVLLPRKVHRLLCRE